MLFPLIVVAVSMLVLVEMEKLLLRRFTSLEGGVV